MELKRILARDIRAANEKAVAQYGPDVLVISSGQVNGLTELIVAVDLAPLTPEEADPFVKSQYASSAKPSGKFDVLLGQTIDQNKRDARERRADQCFCAGIADGNGEEVAFFDDMLKDKIVVVLRYFPEEADPPTKAILTSCSGCSSATTSLFQADRSAARARMASR